MTPGQIYILIEKNGCTCILLKDYSGNKLHEIEEQTPQAANITLEEAIPNFVGYRKLQVLGKKGGSTTPWTKGYIWQMEFPATPEGNKNTSVAASAHNTIGAMDYVNMMERMFSKQMEGQKELLGLQKDLFEQKIKMDTQDPMKWMPMVQALGPALGLKIGGIQGPPAQAGTEQKKELHFQDVSTMNEQQIGEEIGKVSGNLSAKIKGSQMLKVLVAMDSNPNITSSCDKIIALLEALNKKPELLDMAMKFI